MDLSLKNKPTIRTPLLEGTPPLYHYPIDVRPQYDTPVYPYLLSPTSVSVPYHPYYPGITQNLAALPLRLENPMGYSERIPYHHDSEDTRSNASSTHESDHMPDSSSKSLNSDSERDLNCNRLSPKPLLKPSSRPFKAINPLGLTLNSFGVNSDSIEAYEEFRKKMLSQVHNSSATNKNMRRTIQSENPKYSDESYLEKRKRNNEAAKRSRDARRAKEDEIAIRCAFLEQENIKLKIQLANTEKQKKRLLGLTTQ